MRRAYPRDWKAVLGASNQHPPMTLRVNTRRVEPAEYLNELASHGHAATLLEDAAIKLVSPCPVSQLPGFFEGLCSVQDAGAQLATGLLDVADGMRVLDACAAPGGKTGHLLEARTLDLTALDADARRLARVSQNLERLGLHARVVRGDAATPAAWWDGRPFDRILADVPCSASGVVRRHPDIKWTRRSSDLNQFAQTQRRIADALWPLVASGGKMLYATCSIFPTENREQIDAFLARHADAALERDLQLVPDDTHDGFYYAVLVRR